jgi:hypothetical protein
MRRSDRQGSWLASLWRGAWGVRCAVCGLDPVAGDTVSREVNLLLSKTGFHQCILSILTGGERAVASNSVEHNSTKTVIGALIQVP